MLRGLLKAVVILAALVICLMIVSSVLYLTVPFLNLQAVEGALHVPVQVFGGLARLVFVLGPVFVLGFLICLAALALRLLGEHERPESRSESQTLFDVHRGLSRLEERIEALETLLLTKRDRTGRSRTST
jgi:hypothetical protein